MSDTDVALSDETTTNPTLSGDASIVDTVLDLDEALSGDVRRAERTARFCIKPHLHAVLDRLEGELEDLTDAQGRPLEKGADSPLASDARDLDVVMTEYRAAQGEYVAAMRSVTVAAMEPTGWKAFKTKWAKQVAAEQMSDDMRKELVVKCSSRPEISADQYDKLLDRYGEAAMARIGQAAWAACDHTGVDVPKSPVFSAVQRQQALSRS